MTVTATPKPDVPQPVPADEVDEELIAASIPDTTGPYWVTPEIASLWLYRNTRNRPVRATRIAAMARDMKAGHWAYTGEAVKFSSDGRLIDGQHRLKAVVHSETTVKMLVVVDLPEESQAYMDAGARRTAGDAMAFKGETNASLLAATCRFALLLEQRKANTRDSVTHSEVMEWLAEHPDIRRYVGLTVRYSSRIDMKPSVFAYGLWRIFHIDERDATAFLGAIVEMRSLGTGDPIFTFLQRFRTARKNREITTGATELSWLFRTWNAMRSGAQLKQLKVPLSDNEIVEPK